MIDQAEQILFCGSYGAGGDDGPTLHVLAFHRETGKLRVLSHEGSMRNATYLAVHPNGRYLYTTGETKSGELAAFAIEGETLRFLNKVAAHGGAPCYVAVHPGGRWLIAATYSGGNACLAPIHDDGSLGEATDIQQFTGHGADPKRQPGPRAHSAVFDATGTYAFVQDLGTDHVWQFRIDTVNGKLIPNDPPAASLPPGSGPRHLVFHPTLPSVYVINELANTLTHLTYDAGTGTLTPAETCTTLPADFTGASYCADIHVTASGEFVYGSNRGHDSLALFHVEPGSGRLSLAGFTPTGGKWPRNFVLAPGGRFVLVANQHSNNVVIFSLEAETGGLTPTGETLELPAPVCLKFSP